MCLQYLLKLKQNVTQQRLVSPVHPGPEPTWQNYQLQVQPPVTSKQRAKDKKRAPKKKTKHNSLVCWDNWHPRGGQDSGAPRQRTRVTIAKGDRIEQEFERADLMSDDTFAYELEQGVVKDVDTTNEQFYVVYDDKTKFPNAGFVKPMKKPLTVWRKM